MEINRKQNQEKDLMEYVLRLSRMARRSSGKRRGAGHPPRGTMRVLHLLQKNESMRTGDIAEAWDIRPGSVTEILAKMEALELIRREKDADDSRYVNVSMTEKGSETLAESSRHYEERRAKINAVLSEEERDQVIASSEKLIAFFEEQGVSGEDRGRGRGKRRHHGGGRGPGRGSGRKGEKGNFS